MRTDTLNSTGALRFLRKEVFLHRISLITISGPTCSGKTTFARRLADFFRQEEIPSSTVPLDSYFRDCDDPEFPRDADGSLVFDLPSAFYADEFVLSVTKLVSGQSIRLPVYNLRANKRQTEPGLRIFPARVVIAEGLFASLFLQADSLHVSSVFMDTPVEVCLQRRIERDTELFGVNEQEVIDRFRQKVMPYWDLCANQRQKAQLLVNEKGDNHNGR